MKLYKGYLIDLDGTVFRGTEVIPGVKEFIQELIERELPYVFITNNSSTTAEALVERLAKMGIPASKENILTSSIATANYIKQTATHPKCYVIGESGLTSALNDEGIELTDEGVTHVVMGLDRAITYDKLAQAVKFIRKGAKFISTNKDRAIPSEEGLKPGNGALTSVVAVTTKVDPLFMGKPATSMIQIGLNKLNCQAKDVLLIGDNYFTDIKGGIDAKVDTAFVLTGVSEPADIEKTKQPTYILNDLTEYEFED